MMKRHLLEAATLVVAAILCATVANALASRERKMALVGTYPNALKVPHEAPATAVEPGAPPQSTSILPPTETAPATSVPAVSTTIPAATPTTAATATVATTIAPPTASHPSHPATQQLSNPPAPPQPRNAAATPLPPQQTDLTKFKPHPDKPYIEIGYADIAALHNSGALTLDARRTSIYEQGHIAGARSFSVWESDVDDKVRKLFDERSDPAEQEKPIVIYCSGGDCEDSHMLAQKLWGAQFNNVYVYRDGFPDWQKHGAAVHTGGQP